MELSQGSVQMGDLSRAGANSDSGAGPPLLLEPPGSADAAVFAAPCMRLQISLVLQDTYMCSWAEALRYGWAAPAVGNDDAAASSSAAPARPTPAERGLDFDRMNPLQNRFQKMGSRTWRRSTRRRRPPDRSGSGRTSRSASSARGRPASSPRAAANRAPREAAASAADAGLAGADVAWIRRGCGAAGGH